MKNCLENCDTLWASRHEDLLRTIERELLPSGSGVDAGTQIDTNKSTGELVVLETAFHHMDEFGGYDGWTEHTVRVKPSLLFGFVVSVSGRDRNGIKDYISEIIGCCLASDVEVSWDSDSDEYAVRFVD